MENAFGLDLPPMQLAAIGTGLVFLLCFITKAICLVWVFVRSRKVAALVYLGFLLLSAFAPIVIGQFVSSSGFALSIFLINGSSAIIETGLFIWLVRSLLKRRIPPVTPASSPAPEIM